MRLDSGSRLPVKQAPLIFGRYQVIAKIGEGGAGQVFLARAKGEAGFERLFALKVIHWRGDHERVGMTLQHEMKIAAQVHHRNVVGILDFGSYPDGYYLVMEYVEGCTLSELQHRCQAARPPRLVVPIVIDALYGLHAAHSTTDETGARSQLVHRDVSPQNLLIGVDGACRVTDFGIARARNMMRTTRPNVVRGKPAYMSPEQIAGGELDQRSDIFSTGTVLWNALTGKKLFHGPSEHVSMFNVLKRKVPKPSSIGLRPPAYLDALVLKALERDPSKRFQTAEEMATALRDAAMRAGALGAPNEIAQWIGSSFGPELEARRRTMREASEHARVVRIDGDGTSLAAFSSVLPRLEGPGRSGLTDSVERLSVEDLSFASDEVDAVDAALPPAGEPATRESSRARRLRAVPLWGVVLAVAVALAAVLGWRWRGASDRAVAPAARPTQLEPPPSAPVRIAEPVIPAAPSPPPVQPEPASAAPDAAAAAPPSTEATEVVPPRPTRRAPSVRPPRSGADPARRSDEVPAAPAAEPTPSTAPVKDAADDRHVLETNPYLMK